MVYSKAREILKIAKNTWIDKAQKSQMIIKPKIRCRLKRVKSLKKPIKEKLGNQFNNRFKRLKKVTNDET